MENKPNVYSFVGIRKSKSFLIDVTTRLIEELGDYFEIEAQQKPA
ncbi:hypothetical protein NRIC_33970 [Enterococcus florum]|uniref:Uncharacterized protein n=1 Tax=Enterococcus florum TaxID=2480627 RepID=A0A4P5PCG1_9ENTE|nr:hypothetical protein [Enterococcus florum]GCF95506.1 hypothetical protein NRIC_33970 [Enterococcus florum]